MRRRELFGLAAGSALVAHTLQGDLAQAQEYFSTINAPGAAAGKAGTVTGSTGLLHRGTDGRLPRMGSLDLESQQDFTLGFLFVRRRFSVIARIAGWVKRRSAVIA